MSSLYALYCLYYMLPVPEQGGIPPWGLTQLHLSANRQDHCFVLEPCYLWLYDKELRRVSLSGGRKRRPQGKLRLWQEFIITIAPVYNDFVPARTRSREDKRAPSFGRSCVHWTSKRIFNILFTDDIVPDIDTLFLFIVESFIFESTNYLEIVLMPGTIIRGCKTSECGTILVFWMDFLWQMVQVAWGCQQVKDFFLLLLNLLEREHPTFKTGTLCVSHISCN